MHIWRLALRWVPLLLLLVLALVWLFAGPVHAQNPASDLLGLVNSARLNQGLHPYVVNAGLTGAAQRHSDDMAATGQISHTGSDGSSSTQRILDAGYGAYEFGLVASENIYGGTGGAQFPFDEWMGQPGARANVLHQKYREVGIGVASDGQGRTFWTLSVGAQPNVLPVLINDGVTSVDTVSVTLRLVPENVVPDGRGTAMGQPVEYRASSSRQFPDAEWDSWAEKVSFVLNETPGEQTVYVQLRDAAGRTTISQASVTLTGEDVAVTPTEALETEMPGTPTATQTTTVTSTVTPQTSPTPTRTTPPTVTGTATPRPTPTASRTPQPTATATVTPVPTDAPTSTSPPTEIATSAPPTMPPQEVAVVVETPPWPVPSADELEEESDPLALASRLAPWALGLQIVALVLGVYVALRRPSD